MNMQTLALRQLLLSCCVLRLKEEVERGGGGRKVNDLTVDAVFLRIRDHAYNGRPGPAGYESTAGYG